MTCAVLLAAGSGTRFHGDSHKLLSRIDGVAVAARAIEAVLASEVDDCVVVTGAADLTEVVEPFGSQLTVVHNPRYLDGMATSLDVGVLAAAGRGHDAVVVGLADQPFIASSAWSAVARSTAPIAVATYGGKRRNPVRLSSKVWPLLPLTGDDGARVVLHLLPELIEPIACDGSPHDIDTVEDLERWS